MTGDRPAMQKPTRVRYGVLGFVCALAMITYLDRACFGSGASEIIKSLGLHSEADMRWAFTAFAIAYALFEVPSGWLGDRFGPRSVLIRIVLWWSAFTALTGFVGIVAWQGFSFEMPWWRGPVTVTIGWLAVLVIIRFLFGMGEAGAFPSITRALHNWFPISERGFAQGAVWMSGRLLGGLTPMIWALLVSGIANPWKKDESAGLMIPALLPNWRWTFWTFGLIGVCWCLLFVWFFRNRPEEKASVNEAELALTRSGRAESEAAHGGIPWRRMLRSRTLWALGLMYCCQSYGWYFFITYLPKFLEQQHDVASTSFLGAIYKGGPLWMGAIGCLIGGFLTDWFIRRTGNRRWGRRLFGIIGHAATAVCFLICPFLPHPGAFWAFLVISLAGFFTDLTMASAWSACQDVGKRYAAIAAGFMNMVGNVGSALAGYGIGYVLERSEIAYAASLHKTVAGLSSDETMTGLWHGYQLNFLIFAGVFVVGVICWCNIDASRPIVPDEEQA